MGKRSPNAQRLTPCMPPLLEEETKPLSGKIGDTNFGGSSCENIVKSYFLSKQINIAEPHVDNGVDLLIEKPGEGWVRSQVKKVVYQFKLDYTHKKNFNKEIYRSRVRFSFQGGCSSMRKQRTPKEIDYFHHVLLTPYRQLIWETPSSLIPLRKDGSFISGKDPVIDRDNWKRLKSDIDFNQMLLYSKYDPIIFKTYPEFFLKDEQITIDNFF
jgi:hypothetical protein